MKLFLVGIESLKPVPSLISRGGYLRRVDVESYLSVFPLLRYYLYYLFAYPKKDVQDLHMMDCRNYEVRKVHLVFLQRKADSLLYERAEAYEGKSIHSPSCFSLLSRSSNHLVSSQPWKENVLLLFGRSTFHPLDRSG